MKLSFRLFTYFHFHLVMEYSERLESRLEKCQIKVKMQIIYLKKHFNSKFVAASHE